MPAKVLFVPHGGGPLPLLGEPGHAELVAFLKQMAARLTVPDAVVVISAHWEADEATVITTPEPELIYDYYGFPPESYRIAYPAPGAPALGRQCRQLIRDAGLCAKEDSERGFDHGVFVPLKLLYPDASIPVTQVSLLSSLDPQAHMAIGRALSPLRDKNVLVLGSGMSYHNLGVILRGRESVPEEADRMFDDWLIDTCCNGAIEASQRMAALSGWEEAPAARACHPREEHLLPLLVCAGVANGAPAELVFSAPLMGRRVSGFLWS